MPSAWLSVTYFYLREGACSKHCEARSDNVNSYSTFIDSTSLNSPRYGTRVLHLSVHCKLQDPLKASRADSLLVERRAERRGRGA
jgi:hypothetical protein